MTIAIIDYGMGNLRSVQKAFDSLGFQGIITKDIETIKNCDKIVLPGVGAFRDAMIELNQSGMAQIIKEEVKKGKPFLGICLGMQLLFETSYENGKFEGLGLLEGEIVKLSHCNHTLKIPHMGWNELEFTKKDPIFTNLSERSCVYFVHSYYLQTKADIVSAYTEYGMKIPVAVQKDNLYAVQFHPEKSGKTGLKMLENFGRLE